MLVVKRDPNGKTLAVLSHHPHLRQLYEYYCREGTLSDSCQNLRRDLAGDIIALQRALRTMAEIDEIGQKQSPVGGFTFSFGGQLCRGKLICAADYLDTLTSVAELILPQCFATLELIATVLLANHASSRQESMLFVK